jgi:RNA-directed DNA polymerase
MRENRETCSASVNHTDRSAKAQSRTVDAYALQESDRCVVPVKQPNKEGRPSAEAAEGRRRPKENDAQFSTSPTQSGEEVSQGLSGVRRVARVRKQERFTALLHHVTLNLLRESFEALKKNAAPGVDGVTWREYEMGLEDRLIDLHSRVHRGTYRAQPSRRVYIPKADGRQRPLGIAALEDKIVQQAVVTVLNEIYETDFRGFSYGFRPGRNPHQALDALNAGLQKKRVNWVLDADIKGFFDHVSHEWLLKFLRHRVADNRMLRLIQKWLKAGVSEDGEWSETTVGTPQGAVVTPRTQKVTWGRRGSGRATGVRSGLPGVAGLRYGNGMAQRDRISVDENLLHQESKDLLALSYIQCIGAPSQPPAESGQGFGELQILSLIDRGHLQGL